MHNQVGHQETMINISVAVVRRTLLMTVKCLLRDLEVTRFLHSACGNDMKSVN